MRKVSFLFCVLFAFASLQGQTNFWENLKLVNEGVEKPRATFVPYQKMEQAMTGDKFKTPFVQSLNGTWR
nr:hypothetical protein [Parabacteroides sp.]